MRRIQLGDVFYTKVPRGYKLYQYAYKPSKYGTYIRVFPGLYDTIPENIAEIVKAPHSYISYFVISRAYRIGLAVYLGNYPVPEEYPLPNYEICFQVNNHTKKVDAINVMKSSNAAPDCERFDQTFYVERFDQLPKAYQTTLLNGGSNPCVLMHMFNVDFDLEHPEREYIDTNRKEMLLQYLAEVNQLLEKARY